MRTVLRALCALALVGALSPPVSAQCTLSFVGTVTATYSSPPRQVVFAGTVANSGTGSKQVALRVRYSGAGLAGMYNYGPVPLGPTAGTPFSITQSIPLSAPLGTYTLFIELRDLSGGPPGQSCGLQTTTVTVVPPRIGAPNDEVAVGDVAVEGGFFGSLVEAGAVSLVAAAPNPFRDRTELRYTVAEASAVRLAVYDVLGREVAVLVDEEVAAGTHSATFDGRALPAGTYLYRLDAGGASRTGRVTLMR